MQASRKLTRTNRYIQMPEPPPGAATTHNTLLAQGLNPKKLQKQWRRHLSQVGAHCPEVDPLRFAYRTSKHMRPCFPMLNLHWANLERS